MPRKTNAKQEPEQAKICKQDKGSYPTAGWEVWGVQERGGALWCGVNHRIAACMVRTLARQAVGPLMHVSSSGLVEINVL